MQTSILILAGYIAFSWAVGVLWIGWLLLPKTARAGRLSWSKARSTPRARFLPEEVVTPLQHADHCIAKARSAAGARL
jgi:hypothetical protein